MPRLLANPAHAPARASFQGAVFCFGIHRLVADATIALLPFDSDSACALALFVAPAAQGGRRSRLGALISGATPTGSSTSFQPFRCA